MTHQKCISILKCSILATEKGGVHTFNFIRTKIKMSKNNTIKVFVAPENQNNRKI